MWCERFPIPNLNGPIFWFIYGHYICFYYALLLPPTLQEIRFFTSHRSKDWWDLKGAVKNLGPNAINPNPFKQGAPSPMRNLPGANHPNFIKIDPAHTYAIDGIGKSFLASVIVLLMRMGHFGNGAIPTCFDTAYNSFVAYLALTGKSTSITSFEYSTFKLKRGSFLNFKKMVMIFPFLFGDMDPECWRINQPFWEQTQPSEIQGFVVIPKVSEKVMMQQSWDPGLQWKSVASTAIAWNLGAEQAVLFLYTLEWVGLPLGKLSITYIYWFSWGSYLLPTCEEDKFTEIFEVLKWSCVANDRFWRAIYSHGIFIPRAAAVQIVDDGFALTEAGSIRWYYFFPCTSMFC